MTIPARLIRASVEDLPCTRRPLTPRQQETRALILATGRRAMAEFGRRHITLAAFADGIRVSPGAIRQQFCDLDNLLAEILRAHLLDIAHAIGAVPRDAPDGTALRLAAYHLATRTLTGVTEAHLLLMRDRHGLPPDLAADIEQLRHTVGALLAPGHPLAALALLDLPDLEPDQIEAALTALAGPRQQRSNPKLPAKTPAYTEFQPNTYPDMSKLIGPLYARQAEEAAKPPPTAGPKTAGS